MKYSEDESFITHRSAFQVLLLLFPSSLPCYWKNKQKWKWNVSRTLSVNAATASDCGVGHTTCVTRPNWRGHWDNILNQSDWRHAWRVQEVCDVFKFGQRGSKKVKLREKDFLVKCCDFGTFQEGDNQMLGLADEDLGKRREEGFQDTQNKVWHQQRTAEPDSPQVRRLLPDSSPGGLIQPSDLVQEWGSRLQAEISTRSSWFKPSAIFALLMQAQQQRD